MSQIVIAMQPFSGLAKKEIAPIAKKIESVYNVKTVILEPLKDSGCVYNDHYNQGPSEEQCMDQLREIKNYKYKLGVDRDVAQAVARLDENGERTLGLIHLTPLYEKDYYWMKYAIWCGVHESGHLLGMEHCWENGGRVEKDCWMGVVEARRIKKMRFCDKHSKYLLKQHLLKIT